MDRILFFLFLVVWAVPLWGQQVQNAFLQEGISKYSKAEYAAAINLFFKAISDAQRSSDSLTLQAAYSNLGNSYSMIGKTLEAQNYYHQAIDVATLKKDDRQLAKITANLGALYSDQKDFDKAIHYYNQAEEIATRLSFEEVIADCAANKGVIYEQLGDYEAALRFHKQALATYEKHQIIDRIALTYNNLGIVYKFMNNLEESVNCYRKTLQLAMEIGDKYIMAATYANLGNVYLLLDKHEDALAMNHQAQKVATEINAPAIVTEVYGNLSDVYEAQGNYKEAVAYARKYKQSNDELVNLERSAQLTEMKEKYESEKKETENKELKQMAEIRSLELQEQKLKIDKRNLLLGGSVGFILLSGILVFLFFQWQKGKNNQARLEAVRLSEEQERQRIARDLHDDLGAGLSKIKMLTAVATEGYEFTTVQNAMRSLSETATELVGSMRDMVWTLNPENATLDYLVARMREYAYQYLDELPIKLHFLAPKDIPQLRITGMANRNILLIVKESLQNIVKHAEAEMAEIYVNMDHDYLNVQIKDNGKGYDLLTHHGNGLNNMSRRASQIDGELSIHSELGNGTSVTLKVPLDKIAH